MRRHIYWKTYEEYLKWSFSPLKQINLVTKEIKGLNSKKNRVRASGYNHLSRIHIKFID